MIRDGEASLPKCGNKTPNCIFATVGAGGVFNLLTDPSRPELGVRNESICHPGAHNTFSARFVFRIIDNVKVVAGGSVNLEDAGDLIAAVAGLVSHSGWDEGNFSRTKAILFPFDNGLNVSLQDDVNIFRIRMVVRRSRSGIDVNQIDVHVDILCAIGLVH
jgi:hypothetical protein